MTLGMPTLIELDTIEDNITLAKDLNLDFVEINMNMPEYQPYKIDVSNYDALQKKSDIFYTLHLPEDFDPGIFNNDIRASHLKVLGQSIEIAKKLRIPVINFHMNRGIYFTLPKEKIFLYEKYNDEYMSRVKAMMDYVDSVLDGYDIKLCIENTGIHNIDFVKQATELLLESDNFMLTWDVGHDYSAGSKDEKFIHSNIKKLNHMHIHDAIGEKNHLALYSGKIDIGNRLSIARQHDIGVVIETKTIESLTSSVEMLRDRI